MEERSVPLSVIEDWGKSTKLNEVQYTDKLIEKSILLIDRYLVEMGHGNDVDTSVSNCLARQRLGCWAGQGTRQVSAPHWRLTRDSFHFPALKD